MERSSESTALCLRLANTGRRVAAASCPLLVNLMDDITPILIRVIQATCLVLKLLYFTVYCLFILFLTHNNSQQDDSRASQQNLSTIVLLSQFLLVLFTIIIGMVSSATWNTIETRIYAASSFVLFSLNLIKYGVPFMDPVIFSLDCLLLVLAFVSLRMSVGYERIKIGQKRQGIRTTEYCGSKQGLIVCGMPTA